MARDDHARRSANFSDVQRITRASRGEGKDNKQMPSRPKAKGPSLFAASGLDRDAPRPLADKLRPDKLADVVGQDHLLGPDGALTRMLETRSLCSPVFLGAPRARETTLGRGL